MLSHLSGIAVAGSVSSTAVGATTGESSQSSNELPKDAETNISVKEINGEEKKELITKVQKDDDFNYISSNWNNKGFSPQMKGASVWKTSNSGTQHYTVRIPFSTTENSSEAYVTWSNNESVPIVGDYYPDGSSSKEGESVEVVTYTVEESSVVHESATFEPESYQAQSQVQIQSANCVCGNWDLKCIAATASAVAAGGKSCSACYATPAKWECISCAGALMAAGINLSNCCNSGWTCFSTGPILP